MTHSIWQAGRTSQGPQMGHKHAPGAAPKAQHQLAPHDSSEPSSVISPYSCEQVILRGVSTAMGRSTWRLNFQGPRHACTIANHSEGTRKNMPLETYRDPHAVCVAAPGLHPEGPWARVNGQYPSASSRCQITLREPSYTKLNRITQVGVTCPQVLEQSITWTRTII